MGTKHGGKPPRRGKAGSGKVRNEDECAALDPTIPRFKAFALVGRLQYGSELVRLSQREQFLLDTYGLRRSPPSSILPGQITYIDNLGSGLGPSIREEISRAEVQRRWKNSQDNWINGWLADNGFSGPHVNWGHLKTKLFARYGTERVEAYLTQLAQAGIKDYQLDAAKKAVSLETYSDYQRETKITTGYFATQPMEENWAKTNGFSVESVRNARAEFRNKLSSAERAEFEKPGPRPARKRS